MNILPKKRWHVRTKENIARVRRDEAAAAENERNCEKRAKLAEQEARTNALRVKTRAKYDGPKLLIQETSVGVIRKTEHVNFFKELEEGLVTFTGNNKDYEQERKEEKEKYEKQIGYLTYLGQDTVEATGYISWYNKVPERHQREDDKTENTKQKEVNIKSKLLIDPLKSIRSYTGVHLTTKSRELINKTESDHTKNTLAKAVEYHSKRKNKESSFNEEDKSKERIRKTFNTSKHFCYKKKSLIKKHKKTLSSRNNSEETFHRSKVDLEKLRAKRLKREREEKLKAERLLAKLRGERLCEDRPTVSRIEQKYSSQFNPHLAKQNFEFQRKSKNL